MTTHIKSHTLLVGIAATFLASALAGYVYREEHREPVLEIYIFALRSSRAIFVRTPDDEHILIDGGSTSEIVKRITEVLPFYSHRIDTVIATDFDHRNVTGLIDVLDRYEVGRAYVPRYLDRASGSSHPSAQIVTEFYSALERSGIRPYEVAAGDQIRLSGAEEIASDMGVPVTLRVLFPAATSSFTYSRTSPPQLLFAIEHGALRFLFMGDATVKIQKYIASSSRDMLGVEGIHTVMMMTHPGGAGEVSDELVEVTRPDEIIIEKSLKSKGEGSRSRAYDPFAAILPDRRFDLRELEVIRIMSDGRNVHIGEAP